MFYFFVLAVISLNDLQYFDLGNFQSQKLLTFTSKFALSKLSYTSIVWPFKAALSAFENAALLKLLSLNHSKKYLDHLRDYFHL